MRRAVRVQKMPRRRIRRVSFQAISAAALVPLPALVRRWLPDGRRQGHEWVSLTCDDRKPGSFKVCSGRWADFAIGAKGGDACWTPWMVEERFVEAADVMAAQ